MRNSTKMGGSVKKKYQVGGPKKPMMNPAKIQVGKTKPMTPAEKAKAFEKFKKDIEKQVGKSKFPTPKKQMGGPSIPPTPGQTPQDRWKAEEAARKAADAAARKKADQAAFNKRMNQLSKEANPPNPPKGPIGYSRGGTTKKKMAGGGPVIAAPIQTRLGNRPIAGGNMAKGGSLKMVNPGANPGLAKLPAPVRNKMGYAKKGGAKKYQGGGSKTAGQAYMKYVPGAAASDTLTSQGNDPRFAQPYYEDDNFTAKKKMLELTYGDERHDPVYGTERRQQTPQEVAGYEDFLRRLYNKKKGGQAHPGFKAVQAKIAGKSGVSKKAAGAILAASTRKASAKAKAANPRLKRVKG